MKVDFEFDTPDGIMPMTGVAVLSCYDSDGNEQLHYGVFGDPSMLQAVGMYCIALEAAKEEMLGADEVED